MKSNKIILGLAVLSLSCTAMTINPIIGHAIYLGDYNNENMRQKLISEGEKSYVDGVFKSELTKQKIELASNKKNQTLTFNFTVPTWSKVNDSSKGSWIERIAGNGPNQLNPTGMGVPGYDTIYYGNSDKYAGSFSVIGLKAEVDADLADTQTMFSVDNSKRTMNITTTVTLKQDITDAKLPIKYSVKKLLVGTQVSDSNQKTRPNNIPLAVEEVDLVTKKYLELGTLNVPIKNTSTTETTSSSTSSSTTETTSSSTSSSMTETTSSSTGSSTIETTSSSTGSSTTETTSSSTSSSTAETMSTSNERNKTAQSTTRRKSSGVPSVTTTSSSKSSYGTLPKTGEKSQSIWVGLSGIVVIIGTVFFLVLRHKKEKSAE